MKISVRAAHLVAILGSLLFLALSLQAAHNSAIEYDEAYNASVAKNLGLGLGYATSYKTLVPFNPEITTGPGLLLPMAVLIKLWGNRYWVPGATNALISCGLFGLLFALLPQAVDWNSLGNFRRLAVVFALPLFLAFCLGMGIIGFFSVGLGETGATAFVLLGQLAIAFATIQIEATRIRAWAAAGGLLLGLSVLFKFIVVIQIVPTLLLFCLVMRWRNNGQKGRQSFLWSMIPCGFPSLVFFCVAAPYFKWTEQRNFLLDQGSGLDHFDLGFSGQLDRLGLHFLMNAGTVLKTLTGEIAGMYLALLTIVSLAGLFLRLKGTLLPRSTSPRTPADQAILPIFFLYVLVGTASGFGWWLFLSDFGWIRHLLPFLLAALLLLSFSPVLSPPRFGPTALACQILAILFLFVSYNARFARVPAGYPFPASSAEIMKTYTGLRLTPSERASNQVALTDFLTKLVRDDSTARLYGCGWWAVRDAEYLLPTAINFQDIEDPDFQDHPPTAYHRYLVVDRTSWINWQDAASKRANETWCKPSELVYAKGDYSVYLCP